MKTLMAGACIVLTCSCFVAGDIREIDGSNNNLLNASWGSTGSNFLRMTSPDYTDGISQPAGNFRPSPRVISNQIMAQNESILNPNGANDFLWVWGQFLAHDIEQILDTNPPDPFNILVPTGDPQFDLTGASGKVIPLNRSRFDPLTGTGITNPRQQQTFATAWIDGSAVYGSTEERANWLRTGVGGRLKVATTASGDLLPYNDGTQENLGGASSDLFVAGDARANEQSALAMIHTIFVREHNRLAEEIASADATLSDEEIYQKTRKLVGAQMQVITYKEFLPALLGDGQIREYRGYDPSVNGSIRNVFGAAAYRIGHTMISSQILRLDENWQVIPEGNLSLVDAFFNTEAVEMEGGIEALLRGLVFQPHQKIDIHVVDELRNQLMIPEFGLLDLASLNIQRGRDHGLADYNQLRDELRLGRVSDFSEITSNVQLAHDLEVLYGSVDNIDPWVGMLSEDPIPGGNVGQLMSRIIALQFEALRDGDRFYYEICPELTDEELLWLDSITLCDIIENNTGLEGMPENLFIAAPEPGVLVMFVLLSPIILKRRK